MAAERVADAALREDVAYAVAQLRAVLSDRAQRRRLVQNLERLLRRRERHRMAGERAAMHHAVTEPAHDLLAAGEHADRVAVAHRLGERAQIRLDAHQLL